LLISFAIGIGWFIEPFWYWWWWIKLEAVAFIVVIFHHRRVAGFRICLLVLVVMLLMLDLTGSTWHLLVQVLSCLIVERGRAWWQTTRMWKWILLYRHSGMDLRTS